MRSRDGGVGDPRGAEVRRGLIDRDWGGAGQAPEVEPEREPGAPAAAARRG